MKKEKGFKDSRCIFTVFSYIQRTRKIRKLFKKLCVGLNPHLFTKGREPETPGKTRQQEP